MTKKNACEQSEQRERLHAARVCTFQILCAFDLGGIRFPTAENEASLRMLFVPALPESSNEDPAEVSDKALTAASGGAESGVQNQESGESLSEVEVRQTDLITFQGCYESACALYKDLAVVDKLISDNVTGWTVQRMSAVDRTIIRLAVFEGLVAQKIPVGVACSEAVLLSKEFGGEGSSRFINGALGRITREASGSVSQK